MAEPTAPTTSPRPKVRPDRSTPTVVPTVVSDYEGRGIRVDISSTTNPVTQLGQTQSDSKFKVLDDRELTSRGAYIPPQEVAGISFEGGDVPRGFTDTSDWYRDVMGGSARFNDVFLAGSGMDNPQTAAHEFMHRGVNMLRGGYDEDSIRERYGDDAADVIYSKRMEHPLIQAMFESQGNVSFNDYIGRSGMDDAEKQRVFRALKPLTEMALEALEAGGYEPPPTAGEEPMEEADRKILQMERIALEDEAETFLDNLVNFFRSK